MSECGDGGRLVRFDQRLELLGGHVGNANGGDLLALGQARAFGNFALGHGGIVGVTTEAGAFSRVKLLEQFAAATGRAKRPRRIAATGPVWV